MNRLSKRGLFHRAILTVAVVCLGPMALGVDYIKDVRPLLEANCFGCHGADKQKAGLRLDSGSATLRGSEHGKVIVSGHSDQSLLVKALRGTAEDLPRMPLKRRPLTDVQIETISRWIDEGASYPTNEAEILRDANRSHWAFVAPTPSPLPETVDRSWPKNAIDYFVLARLEENGLTPSPGADGVTLIRRVYLDLIGLPPSIEQVDAFVADKRADAYERMVDELLQSRHYGEKWARHWLDVARYADSNGYSIDGARSIWPYRDWVIQAMNENMPFDEFSRQQLAGDLYPKATEMQRVATGFHRNTQINQEGGIDKEQFRVDSVVDRVNTTGVVWLGLTIGCAQCHDHKFDPIFQKEYYQMFAFFNNADEPNLELSSRWKTSGARKAKTMVMKERAKPRETHLFVKGDFTRLGERVWPKTPAVLHPFPEGRNRTRLDLANWLFDRDNPLTARVTVNRIWQRYFGKGLVETENDFGTQGSPPSHPQLLDWLAVEFQQSGWRLKELHHLIVTSATYRQASNVRSELAEKDPHNRLLGRQSRHRLDAEIIRDVALATSGLLSPKMGGPGVYPPQPGGIMNLGQQRKTWRPSQGEDRYRRGMYTFFWRATPNPSLSVFDAPDAFSSCTRRVRSNTPLQALTLLNDPSFLELAIGLGRRLVAGAAESDAERLTRAFRLCVARAPGQDELARLKEFLHDMRTSYGQSPAEAGAFVQDTKMNDEDAIELAAWVSVARAVLNLDETISRQ